MGPLAAPRAIEDVIALGSDRISKLRVGFQGSLKRKDLKE